MGADLKMAGGGRQRIHIRNIHFLMPLLPLCYSTHNHLFCEEEREYSDGHPSHLLLQLVGKRMRAKGF